MRFINMEIKGCFIIEIEKKTDVRGFFARTWDKEIFKRENLNENFSQCSISFNNKKGTIRGMHFQIHPYGETKLVRCTRGSIFDVIIDLRTDSKTFKKWISVELSEKNYRTVYMPEGVAHGFQTLENNTEVFYQMTQFYMPEFARGIRWNDPHFDITWPIKSPTLSEKDSKYADFNERSLI